MNKPIAYHEQCLPGKYTGDPNLYGTVELTIDWAKLVRELGTKAAHNKSKRSSVKYGIKARFLPSKKA